MSSLSDHDQDSRAMFDPREGVTVDTSRPRTPQVHIKTNSPTTMDHSSTGVPDVTLSPPGNKHFAGSRWMNSSPQVVHRGMPLPSWPTQVMETDGLVVNPSALSGGLPEEIRVLRKLKMNDSLSPTQGSPMEQDEQDQAFRFEGAALVGSRRNLPTRHPLITRGSPPKLFTSPTTYVPRSVNQTPLTPPTHTSQSLPGSAAMVLSTSEPSRLVLHNSSIKVMREPIETFECCCCQAAFIEQAGLFTHFTTAHKGRHTHPTNYNYNCRMCGDGFEGRKELDVHLLACGVARTKRSRNSSLSEQRLPGNVHRYSTGSLSPVPHLRIDTPASGRESRLSLASLTSTPSEFELSDFNSADDEQTTIHKLLQKARKQTINTAQVSKATENNGEPISPTRRRKSSISTRFARNVAKNICKAVEAGLIKMEELSEGSEALNVPTGVPDIQKRQPVSERVKERAFPTAKKGKSKKSKDQSPFLGMLACPFAKGDPEKYLTCLLIHRKDMPGLREHLGRVHFGGSTPDGAIRSRDWPTLFLYCFPHWDHHIPEGHFDYAETISTLQSLSLGEPITKFLRDLEKHLVSRRAKELQEMESIYHERSWGRYEDFLNRAQIYDQLPSSSPQPLSSSQPSPQPTIQSGAQGYGYVQDNRPTVTLSVSRDIEFAINRQVDFNFAIGNFSAGDFRYWLDAMFDPPVSFTDNHIIIHEYNVKIVSLQDLEAFLNLELSTRQTHTRCRDNVITIFIRENWTEWLAGTPGHHHLA
ncbi:uncharacterized protein DFL_005798 [Arthrobotrys flagrans]|uniref:C2H2-type domain-containing protein n=1 Tax=Arthrobotrys flagrans TaxID=97331 RepID=A0A436ZYE0_ARTFL|nr:hypothetical protein DFL_005798 [Arthrobotrys flagrans]